MFFKTQLQSIGVGGAIDTSGKRLRFIGDLPVKAGDYVWTDGNVIFGHIPRKSAPSIPIEQPAFPVEGYGNFRGFISPIGVYNYNKQLFFDDWIVNNKYIFEHGTAVLDGQRIIDALVTDDNDVFVVKEGMYLKNQTATYRHPLQQSSHWYPEGTLDLQDSYTGHYPFGVLAFFRYGAGKTITLGATHHLTSNRNDDIVILKNGEVIESFNLKTYADLTINEALSIRDKIMAQSVKEGYTFLSTTTPPADFIASVFARPLAFNINQNGDWDALITTSAYGFCFPYFSFNYSLFCGSFPNDEDKVFSNYLEVCIRAFDEENLPVTIAEPYPPFTGDKKDNDGNFLPEYQQYVLDKCAYLIPRAKFTHNFWLPAPFSASFLFKIHNGVLVDTLREFSGGGMYADDYSHISGDEKGVITHQSCSIQVETKIVRKPISFPIDENYYFTIDASINAIYNNQGEKLLEDPSLLTPKGESYVNYPVKLGTCELDPNASRWATTLGISESNIFNRLVRRFWADPVNVGDSLLYLHYRQNVPTLGRGLEAGIIYDDEVNFFLHSGWLIYEYLSSESPSVFDFQAVELEYYTPPTFFDWIRIKPCFAELKGGQFLFGLRGYPLYKIDANGNAEMIGKELKNFRLNKLKHKAKALDV